MTSDQGGRYGEPADRPEPTSPPGQDVPPAAPQGWGAPPPPQGWNAPPQGWNAPPQGWGPPPPGWQPAPGQPWPAYGAPQVPPPPPGSAEQPLTVRAGIGAFVVNFVLGLVYSVVSFAVMDDLIRDEVAATDDPAITEDVIRTIILIVSVTSLVLALLYALFIWWAWKGRNWARIVLWVLGGFSVLAGTASFGGDTGGTDFLSALSAFQLLALLTGIVLLALKPSNEWYRYMGWARTWGQLR